MPNNMSSRIIFFIYSPSLSSFSSYDSKQIKDIIIKIADKSKKKTGLLRIMAFP
jgi:hypothetical protein